MACSDDLYHDVDNQANAICFEIANSDQWTLMTGTRSSVRKETKDTLCAIRSLSSSDIGLDVYLHQSIATESLCARTTRSVPVNQLNFYQHIGMDAIVWKDSPNSPTSIENYFHNEKVSKDQGWTLSGYRWPGKGMHVSFFSYAPFQAKGLSWSRIVQKQYPEISYIVPSNANEQSDLLFAYTAGYDGKGSTSVPLNYYHALTAVKFETGSKFLPGKITQISIKGVRGSGKHKVGAKEWDTEQSPVASFTQNINSELKELEGQPITSDEVTFMMIPQVLPPNAAIEITYVHKLTGDTHVLSANIAGDQWPMGKIVRYRISLSSIEVEPILQFEGLHGSANDFDLDSHLLTGDFSLKSYAKVTAAGKPVRTIPLPWSTEFSVDNGTSFSTAKPKWIESFPNSGEGSTQMIRHTYQLHDRKMSYDAALQNTDEVKGVYNLSNSTGESDIQNTANCYIINAAGTYSFPVVYGNGVVDGKENESGYIRTAQDPKDQALSRFKNLDNAAIYTPYISRQTDVQDACLIWQDAPGLIQKIELFEEGGVKRVRFTVPKASIRQGNAIIAVRRWKKDESTGHSTQDIVWSWHIWVTPYVLGTSLVTVQKSLVIDMLGKEKAPELMPIPLGFCAYVDPLENFIKLGRSLVVRFKQDISSLGISLAESKVDSKLTLPFELSTNGKGNATYYQWGRKDPMPASVAKETRKELYYDNNEYRFKRADANNNSNNYYKKYGGTAGLASRFPYIFFNYSPFGGGGLGESWTIDTYMNLWNVNLQERDNNNTQYFYPTKSIYDPSPVGFSVMQGGCFKAPSYGYDDIHKIFKYDGGYMNRQANTYEIGKHCAYWTSDAAQPYSSATMYLQGRSWYRNAWGQYHGYGYNVQPLKNKSAF